MAYNNNEFTNTSNNHNDDNNNMMNYHRHIPSHANTGTITGINGFMNRNKLYSPQGMNSSNTNNQNMAMSMIKNDANMNVQYGAAGMNIIDSTNNKSNNLGDDVNEFTNTSNNHNDDNNNMMNYHRHIPSHANTGTITGMNGFMNRNRLYSPQGMNSSNTNNQNLTMWMKENDTTMNTMMIGGGNSMVQQQQHQQKQRLMLQKYITSQQNHGGTDGSYLNPFMMQYGGAGMNMIDSSNNDSNNLGDDENLPIAASVTASGLYSTEVAGEELMKSRKRKKPKDKPKRPLSAYNLFFKEERTKILSRIPDKHQNENKEDQSSTNDIDDHEHDEATEAQENQDEGVLDSDGKKKRKKKKYQKKKIPHGKISFESLAKQIGAKWKGLDSDAKQTYKEKAQEDADRYAREMEEYTKKMSSESNKKTSVNKNATKRNHESIGGLKHLRNVQPPQSMVSTTGFMTDESTNKRQKVEDNSFIPYYEKATGTMSSGSYNQHQPHHHYQHQQQQQQQHIQQMVFNDNSSQTNTASLLQQYNQLMMMGTGNNYQLQQQQQLMLQQQFQSNLHNYQDGNIIINNKTNTKTNTTNNNYNNFAL